MKKEFIYIALAVIAGFVIYKKKFSNSEESKIEKLLSEIELQLEFKAALKPLEVVGRVNTIKDLVDPNLRAKVTDGEKEYVANDFSKIQGAAAAGSRFVTELDINRMGTRIVVNGGRAEASFKLVSTGNDFRELFDVNSEFRKNSGDWQLSYIEVDRQTPR